MTSKDDAIVEKIARELHCEFGGQKLTPFDDLPWKERKSFMNSAEIILDAARPIIEREALEKAKASIDATLNNYLCDMKPGWDDSVTGFNTAWALIRERIRALIPRDEEEKP